MQNTPKRTDKKINFDQYVNQYTDVQKLKNLHFDPAVFYVMDDPTGTYVSTLPSTEVAVTPEDFGIKSVTGLTVTIYGGSIVIGSQEYTCGETNVTIATETSFIGWQYSYVNKVLTIVDFGSSVTYDPLYIRNPLYEYEMNETSTGVSLVRIKKVYQFPANFGNL